MSDLPTSSDPADIASRTALRDELGLVDDPEENLRRLDAAVTFLRAVEHAQPAVTSVASRVALRTSPWRSIVIWCKDVLPGFLASRHHPTLSTAALLACISLIGIGIYRLSSVNSGQSPDDGWRSNAHGDSSAVWRTKSPLVDAQELANRLTLHGCFATVATADSVVTLQVDTTPTACVNAESLLSPLGLIVDIHGRLNVNVLQE